MGKKRRKHSDWADAEIIAEVRKTMEILDIDYMPRALELKEHSAIGYAIEKRGGLRKYADMMGIPLAPNRRPGTYKTPKAKGAYGDRIEKWKGRPSRAFEKEAKAREKGLHYADLQKEETLRLAGRISV